MGIWTIGTCSTCANHGFKFHVPDRRICSCKPRRPRPSRNAWAFWKLSWPGMTGPAISLASIGWPSSVVTMPTMSVSTRCSANCWGAMPCSSAVVGSDHGEERQVEAISAGGEDAELPTFLAAVDEELARVLEIIGVDDPAEDA